MPTILQKKLANNIVDELKSDNPKTISEIAVLSGYAPSTVAGGTTDIIGSKGVQEALKAKGFSVEAADGVVAQILHEGEQEHNRLKAAGMVYERLGANAPTKSVQAVVGLPTTSSDPKLAEIEALRLEFEQKMLEKFN